MSLLTAALLTTAAPLAPVAQAAPAAPAAVASAPLTVDTPIETLVANDKAKAVLEGAIPGITAHPMYDQFKGMSLTQLQPMSNGQLTDEQIAKVKTGLAEIK